MGDVYNLGEIDGIIITELFNGSANAKGDYLLYDKISNYKYLVVNACVDNTSDTDTNKSTKILEVNDISGNVNEYRLFTSNGTSNKYTAIFGFIDDTHLHIESIFSYNASSTGNQWFNPKIYRVIGIN